MSQKSLSHYSLQTFQNMQVEIPGGKLSFYFAVDPATVATIVSVGEFVLNLFLKKDDTPAWVGAFSEQLHTINDKLDTVMSQLRALSVQVHDEFVTYVQVDLKSALQRGADQMSEWTGNVDDSKQAMEDYLGQLQDTVGKAMLYGPASVDIVAIALRFEATLLKLLRTPETQQNRLANYANYFDEANNTNKSGSVANVLAMCQQRANDFHSSNTLVRKNVVYTQPDGRTRFHQDHGGDSWDTTVVFIVSGDPQNGYTGHVELADTNPPLPYELWDQYYRDIWNGALGVVLQQFNQSLCPQYQALLAPVADLQAEETNLGSYIQTVADLKAAMLPAA